MSLQDRLAEKLNGYKIGHYYACWCPFDNHKKPAFLLYPDYAICVSCDWKGNLERLRHELGSAVTFHGIHKATNNRILPRWKKWIKKYDDLEGISQAAHRQAKKNNKYFRTRQVEQFLEQGRFGILDGWATFPVFNQKHEVIDIVVRTIRNRENSAKYVICPYSEEDVRPLYVPNWKRVEQSDTVYVPFGILDAWAFEAIGLAAATGITGKNISIKAISTLKNKYKIIVPDYNEEKAAYKLANELTSMVEVLRLPYKYETKDPDDFRKYLTENEFKKLVLGEFHAS